MKILKYVFISLFLFLFCLTSFAQEIDYEQWYEDHQWLMVKQEKKDWKFLKSSQLKEDFIEKFYKVRDLDKFTFKNEFKISYQKNLEKANKDYPDSKDPRRYIYLLLGEPQSKRSFTDQIIQVTEPFRVRARVGQGEVWRYNFGQQKYQVIFAKISLYQLQQARGRQGGEGFLTYSFRSSNYEILYLGSEKYTDIAGFLKAFFQENFQIKASSDTIKDLKQQILERAESFYKGTISRLRRENYSYEWENGICVLINQFDIKAPEEVGIDIWILFSKDSLSYRSKKRPYKANISLYCEARDADNKQVIYYLDNRVEYAMKKQKSYYYHFQGSLPTGDYKFIFEIGDNIKKKYAREEKNISIVDYSTPVLKATLLIGRPIKARERIQGKPGQLLKQRMFCPAATGNYGERFQDGDEMIAVFDVSGFGRNHYGNSHLELALHFVKGEIKEIIEEGEKKNKFIPFGEVYKYRFRPIEESVSRFQGSVKIKIKELGTKLKLFPGLYRVELSIRDAIINQEGNVEYSQPILIISASAVSDTIRNFIIRRKD